MSSFGSVLKEIRKNRKLTQKMLSEDICSQSVLSRIENDEELPNVVVMQHICQRLGVTIDQIMQFQSVEVRNITEIFQKIANHFRHKEYKKILNYMDEIKIEHQLYLDTDWQQYYYYKGSCQYYLYHLLESTLLDLKKGLAYTYHVNKENISDFEVQIISCIGSIYGSMGNIEEAESFLKMSIHYFHQLPSSRLNAESTKIFYNYAKFLLDQERFQEASEYISQGIKWAMFKTSYYFLSELLALKSELFAINNLMEQATDYKSLSEQLNRIENLTM